MSTPSFSLHPLFSLWSILSASSARAPGDADELCTTALPTRLGSAPLPPNVVALMDSYNYNILLPTSEHTGVWQQVDLDSNNLHRKGSRTEVLNGH